MPLMSWQLWLARDLVVENVLPWQSATINLTPGRVAQSMLSLLVGASHFGKYIKLKVDR